MDNKDLETLRQLITSDQSADRPWLFLIGGVFLLLVSTTTSLKMLGVEIQWGDKKSARAILRLLALASIFAAIYFFLKFDSTPTDFLNSNDPSVLLQRGQTLEELKNYNSALETYKKALTLKPKNPQNIWQRKGSVELELEKYRDAANSFQTALTIQPDFIDAAFLLGISLHKAQDYDRALAAYDKVLKLDESTYSAWYNKALIYEARQQTEEAIKAYKQAYKLNPSDTEAYAALKNLNVAVVPPVTQAKTPKGASTASLEEADTFRIMCGDPLPNDPKLFPIKLYPVYINYNEKNLRKIKVEMCGDASPTADKKFIQVASFTSLRNAERFKNKLVQQFGSGKIGQPNLIRQ